MKRIHLLLLTALLLLAGCGTQDYGGRMMEFGFAEDASMESAKMMARSEAEAPAPMMAEADEIAAVESGEPVSDQSKPAENTRKRIYNGSAGLIVDDTEQVRTKLEDLALESGGYIESSYADYIVLRVPVEQFHRIFDTILGFGTVDHQEISSWDVTEEFADIAQRLDTAKKTRERLYDLLERTTDAEERARILREIGRLSEEIEALGQQIDLLENRIAFSRISVNLIPRLGGDGMQREIPFPWLTYLDPLYPVSDSLKAKVTLNPGEDFAVFDREKIFMAENSEGTSLFIGTIENSPQGDSLFWQKALMFHLADYYAEAEVLDIPLGGSNFKAVRFISKDREPFAYIVAVLADGWDLHVMEIFTPSAERELSALFSALAEGEIR